MFKNAAGKIVKQADGKLGKCCCCIDVWLFQYTCTCEGILQEKDEYLGRFCIGDEPFHAERGNGFIHALSPMTFIVYGSAIGQCQENGTCIQPEEDPGISGSEGHLLIPLPPDPIPPAPTICGCSIANGTQLFQYRFEICQSLYQVTSSITDVIPDGTTEVACADYKYNTATERRNYFHKSLYAYDYFYCNRFLIYESTRKTRDYVSDGYIRYDFQEGNCCDIAYPDGVSSASCVDFYESKLISFSPLVYQETSAFTGEGPCDEPDGCTGAPLGTSSTDDSFSEVTEGRLNYCFSPSANATNTSSVAVVDTGNFYKVLREVLQDCP